MLCFSATSASTIHLEPFQPEQSRDSETPDLQSVRDMISSINSETSISEAEPTISTCYLLIKFIERESGKVACAARKIFSGIFKNQNLQLDKNRFTLVFDNDNEIVLPNFFKEILSHESPVLKGFFDASTQFHLSGISARNFEIFLELIKAGTLKLNIPNLDDLIKLRRQSDQLEIQLAIEKSEKLIVKFIHDLDKNHASSFEKMLNLASGINDLKNSPEVLDLISNYFIERIASNSTTFDRLFKETSRKWTHFQSLARLSVKGITDISLRKISSSLPNLTGLEINDSEELTDQGLSVLSQRLVSLTINGNSKLTANGVQNLVTRLTKLEKLSLDPRTIDNVPLNLSGKRFPMMQSLSIGSGLAIRHPAFISQFPNLKFLSYVNMHNASPLVGLPKGLISVKFLDIFSKFESQELEAMLRRYPDLLGFALHAANFRYQVVSNISQIFSNIKIVSLTGASINDHELKLLVDKFPNLKHLKLKLCTNITESGLKAVRANRPPSFLLEHRV